MKVSYDLRLPLVDSSLEQKIGGGKELVAETNVRAILYVIYFCAHTL